MSSVQFYKLFYTLWRKAWHKEEEKVSGAELDTIFPSFDRSNAGSIYLNFSTTSEKVKFYPLVQHDAEIIRNKNWIKNNIFGTVSMLEFLI